MIDQYINTIQNVDCIKFSEELPEKCIDMIVTSPPYLKGKEYETELDYDSYGTLMNNFLFSARNIIKDNGLLFLNINGHSDFPELPFVVWNLCMQNGWTFVQEIIWYRKNATHYRSNRRLVDLKEFIFIFSAGDNYTIYPERLLVKTTDTYGKRYGETKPINNVWEIDTLTNNQFLELPTNGASYPIEIPSNCIILGSQENDIIFDPFMGSGTTALACLKTNRRFIGCEISKKYCDIAGKRISDYQAQYKMAL